jgi:hypothetical protein
MVDSKNCLHMFTETAKLVGRLAKNYSTYICKNKERRSRTALVPLGRT